MVLWLSNYDSLPTVTEEALFFPWLIVRLCQCWKVFKGVLKIRHTQDSKSNSASTHLFTFPMGKNFLSLTILLYGFPAVTYALLCLLPLLFPVASYFILVLLQHPCYCHVLCCTIFLLFTFIYIFNILCDFAHFQCLPLSFFAAVTVINGLK